MKNKKIVLAFSGGLDTSYCAKYLKNEKQFEIYSAIVNTGGFSKEELQDIEQKAISLGVIIEIERGASSGLSSPGQVEMTASLRVTVSNESVWAERLMVKNVTNVSNIDELIDIVLCDFHV